jgi:arylsulfatase
MDNTIIVYTSDHGEMAGEHKMKGKGGNIYENNIHVPLIIYHPDYVGGRSCKSITSHLDLAPTFVDMATDNDIDANRIKAGVKGYSLMEAMQNTDAPMRNQEGALFVYDMISMLDDDPDVTPQPNGEISMKVDLNNRGYLRGIITQDYKFARYFSPLLFNTPTDVKSLYENNDVELYAMGSDECENMAHPQGNNSELVENFNKRLNNIISREIGVDDGRETSNFIDGIENYGK